MKTHFKYSISIFLLAFLIGPCFFILPKLQAQKNKPILIFQSGFEATSKIVTDSFSHDYGAYIENLTGVDNALHKKNNWDKTWANKLDKGKVTLQSTGGDSSKRYARIVAEPGNPSNKVLKFWLNDYWMASENQQKARVQANIYGIKNGFKEFYQSVRVFLTEDFNAIKSYPNKINWCTISEFWNNEWWIATEKYGFRITLGVGKPTALASELNFILNAENGGPGKEVWKADNTNIKVPIGKWFTMEYYFKEGNKETGRFYMSITEDGEAKQVVFDVHNFTHNIFDVNPNGVTGYNPMKLYTSKDLVTYVKDQGKTLQIYWDDFKLWTNKKPE